MVPRLKPRWNVITFPVLKLIRNITKIIVLI